LTTVWYFFPRLQYYTVLLYFYVLAGAQLKDYHQGLVHYHLPESGQSWARIFGLMESAKNKYQIEDYSVGQTTLEQVKLFFFFYYCLYSTCTFCLTDYFETN
jgi:Trk-type K+ transport system membrane component